MGEFNCLKLPGTPGDALEDDFLLLSDVFPTAYCAAEMARVQPGSTVAVFGAGPVEPSFIVSHRVGLDEAPEAYRRFDQRRDGYTKVILKPGSGAEAQV